MFTDAEGDKYISYMVVNIENAEFKTEFKPVLNGKPVKVSAVAKVGDFPSSEYSTLNYYETIYASVKKYVKSENAKETQDEKLTYICETKEQYDTYVQNFAQAELSNKKNVSVVCFVIAGIFMILLRDEQLCLFFYNGRGGDILNIIEFLRMLRKFLPKYIYTFF